MLVLVALAILTLGQLIIGLLLLLEGQRTRRLDQRLFAIVAFLFVGWTLTVGLLTGIDANGAGHHKTFYVVCNMLSFVLTYAIFLSIYIFSLNYPVSRKLGFWQKGVILAGGILMALAPLPPLAGSFVAEGAKLTYTYGSLSGLVPGYALLVVLSIFVEAGHQLRHDRDQKQRQQTKTLLLGICLTLLHGVTFVVVLPLIFGQLTIFYALGYIAPYYLFVFTGYGLLKQGLFDVRAIAARSLTYVLSLSASSLLYVLPVVLLSTYLLRTPLKVGTLVSLVLLTLIVAALFQPLKNYFNRVTSRFFYRDYYDPQDVLDELSSLLVANVDIDVILQRTREILNNSVKPISVDFLINADGEGKAGLSLRARQELMETKENIVTPETLDGARTTALRNELRRQDIALAIRLRTTHDDLGFLLLGARRSGAPYGQGDQRLLGVFADELGIGLQNALRFEEIRRFNVTLQERVDDATRKLRRANDKLRKLNDTKDDFISMASHQLRTPLTSVKGYVSMVLDGDAGKITRLQRRLLTQSFVSAQRMVYLISDLLNVSRLKTGKFIIEPVRCNLARVVQEEVEQLLETAKGRHLELTYEKPEHFPTLMLDETKLRQVIMNFLDNAVYYTPAGGHIEVHLADRPQSIEFTVVDDGIGVPRHEQHHLFTKFFRAPNAKRARPDGTGLGLFMAKKVVIAQGGAVIFRSQEGRGSTFGFTFAKAKLRPDAYYASVETNSEKEN